MASDDTLLRIAKALESIDDRLSYGIIHVEVRTSIMTDCGLLSTLVLSFLFLTWFLYLFFGGGF